MNYEGLIVIMMLALFVVVMLVFLVGVLCVALLAGRIKKDSKSIVYALSQLFEQEEDDLWN